MRVLPTLKANSSRPVVSPGRGSYRVPALATRASCVVGPMVSRAAILMPPTSDFSNWTVEAAGAAEARNRLWQPGPRKGRRQTREKSDGREIMVPRVEELAVTELWARGRNVCALAYAEDSDDF